MFYQVFDGTMENCIISNLVNIGIILTDEMIKKFTYDILIIEWLNFISIYRQNK